MKFLPKIAIIFTLVAGALFLGTKLSVKAQQTSSTWSQCSDGGQIERCETYDCPQGDTNGDGKCSLLDNGARLVDARSDPFCGNPTSGCGQVYYYKKNSTQACADRIKKEGTCNLDLSKANLPREVVSTSTPTPTSTPTATPTSSPIATATASATPKGGGDTLPKTGPSPWLGLFFIPLGFLGIYLYERGREA